MGIRQKGRRRLVLEGRSYTWWVQPDPDTPFERLNVVSNDRRIVVRYHFAGDHHQELPPDLRIGRPFLIVLGEEFGHPLVGLLPDGKRAPWRRFRCPAWETLGEPGGAITPGVVRQLIEWCVVPPDDLQEVDAYGLALPLGGNCGRCGVSLWFVEGHQRHCAACGEPVPERVRDLEAGAVAGFPR